MAVFAQIVVKIQNPILTWVTLYRTLKLCLQPLFFSIIIIYSINMTQTLCFNLIKQQSLEKSLLIQL